MQKSEKKQLCRSLRIPAGETFQLDFGYILEKLKQGNILLNGDKQADGFTFYIFISPDRGSSGVNEGKSWHNFQNGILAYKSENQVIKCQANYGGNAIEINGLRVFITNGSVIGTLEALLTGMTVDKQIEVLTLNGFTEISFYGLQEVYDVKYDGDKILGIGGYINKGYVFCVGNNHPESHIIASINLFAPNEIVENFQFTTMKDNTAQSQQTALSGSYNMHPAPNINSIVPYVYNESFLSLANKLKDRDFKFDLCYVIKSIYEKDKHFIKDFNSDKFQFAIFTNTKQNYCCGVMSFINAQGDTIIRFDKSLEISNVKIFIKHYVNESEINKFDKEHSNLTMESLKQHGFKEIGIYWYLLNRNSIPYDPLKSYIETSGFVLCTEMNGKTEKLVDIDLFSDKNIYKSIIDCTNTWRAMQLSQEESNKESKPMLIDDKFKEEQK